MSTDNQFKIIVDVKAEWDAAVVLFPSFLKNGIFYDLPLDLTPIAIISQIPHIQLSTDT